MKHNIINWEIRNKTIDNYYLTEILSHELVLVRSSLKTWKDWMAISFFVDLVINGNWSCDVVNFKQRRMKASNGTRDARIIQLETDKLDVPVSNS